MKMKTVRDIYNFLQYIRLNDFFVNEDEFMVANPMFAEYITNFKKLSMYRFVVKMQIKNVNIHVHTNPRTSFIFFKDVHATVYFDDDSLFSGDIVEFWLEENNKNFMDLTFEELDILKFYFECTKGILPEIYFINRLKLSRVYADVDEFVSVHDNPKVSEYLNRFSYGKGIINHIIDFKIDDIYIVLFFGEHGVLISFEDVLMEFDIDGKILFGNDLVMKWLSMNNMKFMDLTFDDIKILMLYQSITFS